MNPAFQKLLKAKKKRSLNPDIVRPNLFSQAKELKLTKDDLEGLRLELFSARQRIDSLESRNRKLESSLEALRNWIKTRK